MGLFSADVELRPEIQGAIAAHFWLDEVPARHRKEAPKKIGAVQDDILGMLAAGEELICITPSYTSNMGYDGLGILTNQRIFKFKRKLEKQIRLDNFGDTQFKVHPQGYFVMDIMSREALAFQSFAHGNVKDKGTQKFWEGTIVLYLDTEWLMNDLDQKIQMAQGA